MLNEKYSKDSKILDVYRTPVGHDLLYKAFRELKKYEIFINNQLFGSFEFEKLQKFGMRKVNESFFEEYFKQVNSEIERPFNGTRDIKEEKYKEAIYYQGDEVYFDNEKLKELKTLGVDAILIENIGAGISDVISNAKAIGLMVIAEIVAVIDTNKKNSENCYLGYELEISDTSLHNVEDVVKEMLSKGVDGICLDLRFKENISKSVFEAVSDYAYGPALHSFIKEIRKNAIDSNNALFLGKVQGTGMEMAKLLSGEERGEFHMVFDYDHFENPGFVSYNGYVYDLNPYKKHIMRWINNFGNNCFMPVFFNDKDNPLMSDKISPTGEYKLAVSKLLAVLQFTLPGATFLYQGEETEISDTIKVLSDLRKSSKTLIYGNFETDNMILNRFTFRRRLGDECYIMECNIGARFQRSYELKNELIYTSKNKGESMSPYEVRIYKEVK